MTNQPIIISGEYPDPFPKDASENITHEDGSINWYAAFNADPGVRKCEHCNTYYWNLAKVMRCPKCNIEFGDGVEHKAEGKSNGQ